MQLKPIDMAVLDTRLRAKAKQSTIKAGDEKAAPPR